jgi:hypothetical protein
MLKVIVDAVILCRLSLFHSLEKAILSEVGLVITTANHICTNFHLIITAAIIVSMLIEVLDW